MIKNVNAQGDMTIINIYAPNNKGPKIHETKTDRIEVKQEIQK